MARFTLTGFGDEIADDLETQLDVLTSEGIECVELRSVDGTNVLDLSEEQVADVHDLLEEYGVAVSSIGSPIGKIEITDPFDPHMDRFETAIEMAHEFDTPYIRLFSYWMPEDEDPEDHREEVLRRMEAKVERAEEEGIVLLHENEKDIYGDTPGRCRDMLTTVDSPSFRAIFDPANFLEIGVRPFPDALLQVIEYVDYLHIKDAVFGERHNIKPAGEGDGDIPALIETMQARDFEGFASLEPHLADQHETGGFSGPEAFRVASQAFQGVLDEAGATYD